MLNSSAGGVFQAIGNTRLLFWNSCINTLITVIAILIGVFVGKDITSLAFAVSLAYIFHFFTAFYMLIKMGFKYKLSKFFVDITPEFILLLGMELAIILYPFHIQNIVLSGLIKVLFLLIVFILLLLITGEYRLFKSLKK